MAKPKRQQLRSSNATFQSLLQDSQSFLQKRNFTCAHKFALLAQQADPAHPAPPVLIAISSVLKSPPSDHYAVLNLPPGTHSPSLIKTHFHNLISLLNPPQNPPSPFAAQARNMVLKAWAVLSDENEKLKYGKGGGRADSFWTACPYCYHLFEYLKVYEGCLLRCQNGDCGKVIYGAALEAPPPQELLEKGEYSCPPFLLVSNGGNVWSPFGSFLCGRKEKEEKKGREFVSIEISDDDDMEEEAFVGDMEVDCGVKVAEEGEVVGEKCGGEVVEEQGCGGEVVCGRRIKKSAPKNCRKIMGRGVRVGRDEVLRMWGVENSGCGSGDMGYSLNHRAGTGGFDFNDGDEDIFVMLQDVVVPIV